MGSISKLYKTYYYKNWDRSDCPLLLSSEMVSRETVNFLFQVRILTEQLSEADLHKWSLDKELD